MCGSISRCSILFSSSIVSTPIPHQFDSVALQVFTSVGVSHSFVILKKK